MLAPIYISLIKSLGLSHLHTCPQVSDWADAIYNFVRTYGLTDSVMVVDELSSGDDVTGTGATSGHSLRSLGLLTYLLTCFL